MFGPTGCLTETALANAGPDATPTAWGIFPRVALALLRSESALTLQASAIEVYNNIAYDLLNNGETLQVSRTKPKNEILVTGGRCETGTRDHTTTAGSDFAHPTSCQCFKCFQAKSKAKEAKKKAAKTKLPYLTRRGAEKSKKNEFATVGEKLWPIKTGTDVARLAMQVEASRRAAGHKLNDRSSRSHCLVRLHLTSSASSGSSKSKGKRLVLRRQFLFVDLAGSERMHKSGVKGERATEAKQINKSLTVLGRVIRALGEGQAHVPFRDSTLTMLLRSSFDVKAATGAHASVVINVAPGDEHKDETICSLRFGQRMARVSNRAKVVVGTDAAKEQSHLQASVTALRHKLEALADAGMGGGFVANAIPSEKKSLMMNQKRWEGAKKNLLSLQKQLAEASTTTAGKFDHGATKSSASTSLISELKRKIMEAAAQEEVVRGILERQKTIKKLWLEPKPQYRALQAELADLEAKLAQNLI